MTKEAYKFFLDVLRLGNIAVKKARDENRKLGLPNVFFRDGKIRYELPNGKLTTVNPLK